MTSVLQAATLSPLVNGYNISAGPPRTIVVPNASKLAPLQESTVTGTLLKKQLVTLDLHTGNRTAKLAANHGVYTITAGDGDLHFCLGTEQLQPHIACELQNAKAWLALFNQAVGTNISVTGFFRCLFEHPGFRVNDDAHCFEIHPVRAVTLNGQTHTFDVDVPDQAAIHTWTNPHPLNVQDNRIKVKYDKAKDTLTFTEMDGEDENYVLVSGTISNVKILPGGGPPSSFTLTSKDIGHPVQVYCMQGTSASRQLQAIEGAGATDVDMVGLRNIDLEQALKNSYTINLLAISIKETSGKLESYPLTSPGAWMT